MRIICVDDEVLILRLTAQMCRKLPQVEDVQEFSSAADALEWIGSNPVDIALLDIDMPEMNGIALAKKIKEISPDTSLIFVTGYAQYAVEAFALHASGYLLKPISAERLSAEISFVMGNHPVEEEPHIRVRTFGNFDVMVDGKPVRFSRSKSKELLAYLIDRQGSTVTRAEAFSVLWESGLYDRSKQKQLDVILRSLKATLKEYSISEILDTGGGTIRVRPETFYCDMYRFLEGDINAINSYRGEYMSAYSWASMTEAYIDGNNRKRSQ